MNFAPLLEPDGGTGLPLLKLEGRPGIGPLMGRSRRRRLSPLLKRGGRRGVFSSRSYRRGVGLAPSWSGEGMGEETWAWRWRRKRG